MNGSPIMLYAVLLLCAVGLGRSLERRHWIRHGLKPGPKAPLEISGRRWLVCEDVAQPAPLPGRHYVSLVLLSGLLSVNAPRSLVALLWRRLVFGLSKYGTLIQSDNGRDCLIDAGDEMGDLMQYLTQAALEAYPAPGEVDHAKAARLAATLREAEEALSLFRVICGEIRDEGPGAFPLPSEYGELLATTQPSMEGIPENGSA